MRCEKEKKNEKEILKLRKHLMRLKRETSVLTFLRPSEDVALFLGFNHLQDWLSSSVKVRGVRFQPLKV